jgi:hypothetical protein
VALGFVAVAQTAGELERPRQRPVRLTEDGVGLVVEPGVEDGSHPAVEHLGGENLSRILVKAVEPAQPAQARAFRGHQLEFVAVGLRLARQSVDRQRRVRPVAVDDAPQLLALHGRDQLQRSEAQVRVQLDRDFGLLEPTLGVQQVGAHLVRVGAVGGGGGEAEGGSGETEQSAGGGVARFELRIGVVAEVRGARDEREALAQPGEA